jgi:carbon-monoxide dehydrogenase small subunit
VKVTVTVNGQERSAEVEPRLLLVHFLRGKLGLTGTHVGCDTTSCGACTVLLDGTPVKSCTMFTVQAEGREVTTVEGLAAAGTMHPIQQGFKEEHGLQCGPVRQPVPLHRVPEHRQRRAVDGAQAPVRQRRHRRQLGGRP